MRSSQGFRGGKAEQRTVAYLGDHHMAIEGASATSCLGALDLRPYLGHNRGSERDVGYLGKV